MRTNKKGFTLIELLAVIVILAIISLITVPVVINIINNAKKGSAEDSTYGVIEAAKLFWAANQIDFKDTNAIVTFTCKTGGCTTIIEGSTATTLEISGTQPSNTDADQGTIVIDDGTISVSGLKFGDYTCSKSASSYKVSCHS